MSTIKPGSAAAGNAAWLPGLRLLEPDSVRIASLLGPELRGPSQLRVAFDAAGVSA
ncbi:hypothetical protein [Mycolicibacter icosiumassiliensis]|uniref:hypothetical protein n=1 Tax=Mycolicibacter icosiumassiliensis TaxID=1792835 RepID=UPI000B1AABF5|nr:hypothetical protein [Mycolicibacter icosiumassiliensis]